VIVQIERKRWCSEIDKLLEVKRGLEGKVSRWGEMGVGLFLDTCVGGMPIVARSPKVF